MESVAARGSSGVSDALAAAGSAAAGAGAGVGSAAGAGCAGAAAAGSTAGSAGFSGAEGAGDTAGSAGAAVAAGALAGACAAGVAAGCEAAGVAAGADSGVAGGFSDASACARAAAASAASSAGSRLTNTRFLRTSTWMVRERPVASACRISEVWRRVSVIFLPSAAPPCARRSESSSFALSLSVTASSTDLRSTPAERSCSSSTLAGIFSSVANWATVLLDIRLSSCVRRSNNMTSAIQ
jgi:hypothetical protein